MAQIARIGAILINLTKERTMSLTTPDGSTFRFIGVNEIRVTGIEPDLQTFHQQSFNATLGSNLFAGRKVSDFEYTQNFNETAQEVGLRAHAPAPGGDKHKLRSLTRLGSGLIAKT